jgi:integrase
MDITALSKKELVSIINELTQENVFLKSKFNNNINNILFCDFIEEWLEKERFKWQDTTYEGYKNIVHNHIVPYFGENLVYLKDMTFSDIEDYYLSKIMDGFSTNTIRRHHSNIRRCLRYAVKKNLIKSNPAHLVDLPKLSKSLVDYYNADDLITLFKHTKHADIYPIVLLASLGLRRSEAIGVRWDNIDVESKTLKVCKKVIPLTGKPINIKDMLKSRTSYRNISIPEFFINELNYVFGRQVHNFQSDFDSYNRRYLDYVCVNKKGNLISPSTSSHSFLYIIRKYALKHITIKGLRHTCASLINSQGFNLKYIQDWLGHSTISITADTYTHMNMSQKDEISKSLQSGFFNDIDKNN